MEHNLISCDECKADFAADKIEFKHTDAVVDEKQFEVVYYKCPTCGKVYVVCMLDYLGKRHQDKYVAAIDSYRAALKRGVSPIKLKQKLAKVEALKEEAMAYQNETLHRYGNLLPEEIFV